MPEGTVKWFNARKGYGFISMEDGDDIFCHYSDIEMEGFKTLEENQRVTFEIKDGPKGLQAIHIRAAEE
ncbi:MAG: cold-shock protein [Spirochaetes bacterium]|nr:cold-shock protein [Spirochaetota bacterium]